MKLTDRMELRATRAWLLRHACAHSVTERPDERNLCRWVGSIDECGSCHVCRGAWTAWERPPVCRHAKAAQDCPSARTEASHEDTP